MLLDEVPELLPIEEWLGLLGRLTGREVVLGNEIPPEEFELFERLERTAAVTTARPIASAASRASRARWAARR